MDEALDWFWGLLQGDFNEDPSLSQTIVGSIITAIPILDQLADVRDVIANLHALSKDIDDKWKWIALAITLLGLIPVFGSLLKGVFKVLVNAIRQGGKHLDEALEVILAIVRGAGKGDPVRYLRNLPMQQYTRQVLERFNDICDKIRFAISDVRHSWLARTAFGDKLRRLELVENQIARLKQVGQQKIPDVMRFLKQELDKLLDRAKPAKLHGSTNTANTLAHSAKPLLRLEYEVAVKQRVGGLVGAMRKAGKSDAEIAEAAGLERRMIGQEFKDQTDPALRDIIYRRNIEKYGDPLGPKYEDLKRGYAIDPKTKERIYISKDKLPKSDVTIIEAAQSPGDDLPWDVILEYQLSMANGDANKSAALLQKIDQIVNRKK